RFTLPGVPRIATVTLKAIKPLYRYVSGGKVSKQGDAFQVQDVVMTPLRGTLAGRVTNAAGAPVVGARVLALEGLPVARTTTGNDGRFTLQALPEGKVTVLAATSSEIAQVQTLAGETPVALTVTPPQPVPAANRVAAIALLDKLARSGPPNQRVYL